MDLTVSFALFSTSLGACAIAWTERGIVGVELPGDEAVVRPRMARRFSRVRETAPTDAIAKTIDEIRALLAGERRTLRSAIVDMTAVSPFDRRVLEATRDIPPGETSTYGEIATRIGSPGSAREVGGALARNPFPIIVPCHRVLAAGGKTGGFSGAGGVPTKLRLLAIERSPGPLFDMADSGTP